jgi:hypothetical protein
MMSTTATATAAAAALALLLAVTLPPLEASAGARAGRGRRRVHRVGMHRLDPRWWQHKRGAQQGDAYEAYYVVVRGPPGPEPPGGGAVQVEPS